MPGSRPAVSAQALTLHTSMLWVSRRILSSLASLGRSYKRVGSVLWLFKSGVTADATGLSARPPHLSLH